MYVFTGSSFREPSTVVSHYILFDAEGPGRRTPIIQIYSDSMLLRARQRRPEINEAGSRCFCGFVRWLGGPKRASAFISNADAVLHLYAADPWLQRDFVGLYWLVLSISCRHSMSLRIAPEWNYSSLCWPIECLPYATCRVRR